jgi:ribosomal protein S12 methylthiotransferase
LDIYKDRKLAELMTELSKVDGIEWLRLHYAFPSGFPEDVLEVIANNPKVCKYIDIPLQHISDPLLKSMKRGTTREKTYELLKNFRSQVPGIAIRTTLITGYPGETAEDHEQMKQFIKDIQFDRLGVFTYSHEENTTAFKLKDNVPMELKQERASDLMEIQQGISYELNQQKIGKTFKVLFDKTENGFFIGRTEFDSPEVDNEVMVDTKNNFVRLGDFANVQIESAEEFDLVGNVIV